MIPIVIDIEASGFGAGSYPIEVGVVLPEGGAYCSLISPQPDWTRWDSDAQRVHGISRELVIAHGRSVEEVASRLNDLLDHQTVYSDAWAFDFPWLALLFDRAGLALRFRVESLRRIMTEDQQRCWEAARQQVTQELGLTRHRASSDAKILQLTYVRTVEMAACG